MQIYAYNHPLKRIFVHDEEQNVYAFTWCYATDTI